MRICRPPADLLRDRNTNMTDQRPDLDPDDRKARFEALLALALDEAPAPPRPSVTDIAAWYDGKLAGAQADAVQTWVARSPEGHALWSSLPPPASVTSATKIIPLAGRRRSPVRTAALTLVPAALAATVLLTVLPRGTPTVDESLDSFAASLNTPVRFAPPASAKSLLQMVDADQAAFASGVRSVLQPRTQESAQWQTWLAGLPEESRASCAPDAAAGCSERLALLRSAGRWSGLAVLACRDAAPNPPVLPASFLAVADDLARQLQALQPTGFAASVASSLQAGADVSARCNAASRQISLLR